MIARRFVVLKWLVGIILAAGLVGVAPLVVSQLKGKSPTPTKAIAAEEGLPTTELVTAQPDTLAVPHDVMDSLKVRLTEVQPAPPPQPLKLLGSLFVDVNRLVRVHSRFTGEIADLGTIEAPNEPSETPEASTSLGEPVKRRPLRFGDTVKKGQLLAVVWSREVGEKKSELVDAMSRLNLHAATLQRLQKLEKGVVSERVMREAESDYELDVIAVERAERTLRSWRLPEREIEKVRAEAERIRQHKLESDPALDRSWAEIEIHSPIDGVVLEKNVAMGDIVDSSLELFKIADLSKLSVFASVYEDDLPLIVALPPASRRWMIQFNSNPEAPPVAGTFDLIGDIIDANQHTDSIIGRVDNPGRELRIGQFVTVTVPFPQVAGEVAVPSSALIEDGQASTIFVASNPERTHFTRRNVLVSRRTADHVCIRSRPTPAELAAGAQPLDVGDWVVTSGVVELASTLKTLKSMHPEAALSQSEKATPKPAGNPGG